MAEKKEDSSACDFHSCSSKLVCPVSLVSLLICTAALVRVEIINQRFHDVEDLVVNARQVQNLIKVSTDATSFKRSERVESVEDHKISKERRDATEVHIGRIRRFSSEAGTKPDELTMESVRSEINKTLNSLTSRSFCSPKEQICVQGPPGMQGPKGSRGKKGPRGATGRKGSRGSRGERGPYGKQGIMGPPGQKGEQGIMGKPGPKGTQGITGPKGPKGEQGIIGTPGPKGKQGIMGPKGTKGEQGIMGTPGPKGKEGIMGPKGTKGRQGIMGTPGPKGKQGIMGPKGTKGEQGIMGTPGPKGKQGIMGPKGTKGRQGIIVSSAPISLPTVVISPMRQTIATKNSAVFQCSVKGNPKPTVTWLRKGSTPLTNRDGRLEVRDATLDDSGEYTCIGRNLLGTANKTASLIVQVQFTTNGGRGRFGAIQKFTVTKTARYRIIAWGARGGTHSYNHGFRPGTYYGGYGARIQGTFRLTKGTVLNVVVGQRGGDSVEVKGGRSTTRTAAQLGLSVEDNAGTGGGGGSFVYTTSNRLLLAAGGGGGGSSGYNGMDGQAGTSGTSSVGQTSSRARKEGTGGQPGECNSAGASYHGGVGAGWYAQGCDRAGSEHGERGRSRAQGWIGGQAGGMNSGNNGGPSPGAVGGFGGGGGGSEDNGASGGGGGYSGGGSGTHPRQAGGGGGSYCSGESCYGVTGDNVDDDGLVQVVVISD